MDENVSERLNAAISEVLNEQTGAFVNKWVLVVDSVSDDGRSCAYIASEGMMSWEVIGMSQAASEFARAQLTYDVFEDDEDDEEET